MTSSTPAHSKFLSIGTVLRPHGLDGAVRARLDLMDVGILDGISNLQAVLANGSKENLILAGYHAHAKWVILRFAERIDRSGVEPLRGAELLVDRKDLPPLDEGEYYLSELVGYEVELDSGLLLGPVNEVWDLPANDVLQVFHENREILIPFIDIVVREVDHQQKKIIITPIEGLLQ